MATWVWNLRERNLPRFFFGQERLYHLALGIAGAGVSQLFSKELQVLSVNEPFHGTALPIQERDGLYHGL